MTGHGVTAWGGSALLVRAHTVARGRAVFEIDGDRVEAPAGTLVFVRSRTTRMASATEEGTIIIAVEGTPGKAYEARGPIRDAPAFRQLVND